MYVFPNIRHFFGPYTTHNFELHWLSWYGQYSTEREKMATKKKKNTRRAANTHSFQRLP